MGLPKALLADDRGNPLAALVAARMLSAGCHRVVVVLGAEAAQARQLLEIVLPDLPGEVAVVEAEDWATGMAASLRRGLEEVESSEAQAVLVSLVDLPDVDAPVMRRVVETWRADGSSAEALVRATYAGRPGHPVLLGRAHWAPLAGSVTGDAGAGPYLAARKVREVSCEDLATGRDLDTPSDRVPSEPGRD